MDPNATAADIEEVLLNILRENRPGKSDERGCNTHLEIYEREIQTRLLEPLLKARADAGMIGALDDLGHDTHFKACWNRAVEGTPEPWDCRTLAAAYVRAAVKPVPELLRKVYGKDYDAIDTALLSRLPDILTGAMRPDPVSVMGLSSWVEGRPLFAELGAGTPRLCEKGGADLEAAPAYKPCLTEAAGGTEYLGLMSFQGKGICHDTGIKAWQAFRKAQDSQNNAHVDLYGSMIGRILATLRDRRGLGISSQMLRQDESVSVDIREDGFVVYRGEVRGMKRVVDEGHFLCGPRAAFKKMFLTGGFTPEECDAYITALAKTSSAFLAAVPDGASERIHIDPETLMAFETDPDQMLYDLDPADAVPIFAAGTFPMPEMTTHRERVAAKIEAVSTPEM